MKIDKFNLVYLHNEELFQFLVELKQLVEKTGADVLRIEDLFAVLMRLFEQLDIAMESVRKDGYTEELARLDLLREKTYRGFMLLTKAYLHSMHRNRVDAARSIKIVADACGDLRYKSYAASTAAVHIFLNELRARCAAAVDLLGASSWVHDLETVNNDFDGLMQIRFDERAEQEHINLRQTRREAEKVYIRIVDRIRAMMALNGEEAYVVFTEQLNRRVLYYKNMIARRKGRRAKTKGKKEAMPQEEASPDVAPEEKGLPDF